MNVLRRVSNSLHIGALAAIQRTVPRWPEAWLHLAQRKRLQAMVTHAAETVPYYRRTRLRRVRVIGVAGSLGKTTAAHAITVDPGD